MTAMNFWKCVYELSDFILVLVFMLISELSAVHIGILGCC